MASIRLNKTHRDVLMTFAKANVSCPDEQSVRDEHYNHAANGVKADVEKRFPAKDMAVLKKYGVAGPDYCINGGTPEGMFLRFDFDREDPRAPLVPGRYCSTRSIPFSSETASAIMECDRADEVLAKARKTKMEAYKALIFSARTYEEILDVWPAAAALSDRIGSPSTAVVALSEDVARLIRKDNAGSAIAA
jgi:hypothetical protein